MTASAALPAQLPPVRAVRDRRSAIGRVIRDRLYHSAYQPIVSLSNRRLEGFECLTRFERSVGKSPDLWFLEAAKAGLAHRLEVDTLGCALRALKVLPPSIYLSVNVSADALRQGELLALLQTIDPKRIVLELTEHHPVHDYDSLNAVLGPLRAAGLRLAIDDVGTGYADLQHLVRLRPDVVKFDISLTSRVLDCRTSRAMMEGLVTFTHTIGGRVVAEGIETAEQYHALHALAVDAGQGYFLGRPIGAGIAKA